jgi:alkyl sulfatase BDS1-like metallo-beta-lactamase superfamily hydrolase
MTSFASQADLKPKKISFRKLSRNAYAFTAEGDPNTGVIVGDDGVMVIDTQATPLMAREVIRRVRRVTSKPIKYVVLTHSVWTGAAVPSGPRARGASHRAVPPRGTSPAWPP